MANPKSWLATAAMFMLAACGSGGDEGQAQQKLPPGEQLRLAQTEIADMKAVGAEVTTRDQAEALARIPGTLVQLDVREGDVVTRGQRIGLIIDARLGFETGARSAQVAAAQAEATRARADLSRIQDLYDNQVYAKARLDQAVATAHAADAQLAAARAQQGASASVAGQGIVLAPASGRVLRSDIPAGAVVVPGMSIATVTAGPPTLRLALPESLADTVRPGARVTLAADALPGGMRSGTVTQVYPAITNGSIRVDATVPGLTTEAVGRRLSAAIEVGKRRALVVPRRFIATRYGVDYVSIVTANHALNQVVVQTAPAPDPDTVEILSGARPGDTLFAAGKAR